MINYSTRDAIKDSVITTFLYQQYSILLKIENEIDKRKKMQLSLFIHQPTLKFFMNEFKLKDKQDKGEKIIPLTLSLTEEINLTEKYKKYISKKGEDIQEILDNYFPEHNKLKRNEKIIYSIGYVLEKFGKGLMFISFFLGFGFIYYLLKLNILYAIICLGGSFVTAFLWYVLFRSKGISL